MKSILPFGEEVPGFSIPVLNEREARAGAGILFLGAFLAFAHTWFNGDMYYTKVFIVAFFIDFVIRVFVHPRYAPSLIMGRFFVQNQKPEYVGAIQKHFAWTLGLALAGLMFVLVILLGIVGPLPLSICILCLFLLFSETAFGICLGCLMYERITKHKPELCPGGTCEVHIREPIQELSRTQTIVFTTYAIVLGTLLFFGHTLMTTIPTFFGYEPSCETPTWARAIGHEDMWQKHHGCQSF